MKKYILSLIIIFLCSTVFSHPHLFIESRAAFVFNNEELMGIRVTWEFDDMFSSQMIQDYDIDKDSNFSLSEINKIKDEAFSNLKNYNYFSHIHINGKIVKVNNVSDFNALISNKSILVYTFFIPLKMKKLEKKQILKFAVYDNTYFAAVNYPKNHPVMARGLSEKNYSYSIIDNTKNSYYNGQVSPLEIFFKFWN